MCKFVVTRKNAKCAFNFMIFFFCPFAAKTFLTVRHNNYIYHTEDWRPKGCTRYIPLHEDIMINTQNIEQISFECDQFFLADEKGNYVGAKPG